MAAMVETGAVPRRRSARLAKSGVGADATPAMPSQPVRGSSKKAVSTPPPRPEQEKATLTRKRKRSAGDTPGAGGGGDTKADPGLSPGPAGDEREPGPCQYWLFKSEPETRMTNGVDVKFSIDDLRDCTEPEPWGGVRNYLARNNMMAMKEGDLGFFYHSNTKVPGIVGVCEVVETAGVDETAFDPKDPYYDPKSDRQSPRWFCVKVRFHTKFGATIPLSTLQSEAKKPGSKLGEMQVATMRRAASVSAVKKAEWDWIMANLVPR